jgi:tRNA(Ile)-lysidine synthase TilS/MesJ|tara:strand:+ start:4709 stop:5221 length:513 start_codon:yes stop_codon:yes gene_type:complete
MADWDLGQGFAHKKGKVETASAYEAFTLYLNLGTRRSQRQVATILNVSLKTVETYSKRYAWRERAAAYDADAIKKRFKEVAQNREEEHRKAIAKFRDDQARRAKAMGNLAELMLDLTQEKMQAMRAAGELPSEQQLSNLAKTVATLSETSMNLEAAALGVDELLETHLDE